MANLQLSGVNSMRRIVEFYLLAYSNVMGYGWIKLDGRFFVMRISCLAAGWIPCYMGLALTANISDKNYVL